MHGMQIHLSSSLSISAFDIVAHKKGISNAFLDDGGHPRWYEITGVTLYFTIVLDFRHFAKTILGASGNRVTCSISIKNKLVIV